MNMARELNTLFFCIGTLFLMVGWLSVQLMTAQRRIRALENPEPATVRTCSAHGYVEPCDICARMRGHFGEMRWVPLDEHSCVGSGSLRGFTSYTP